MSNGCICCTLREDLLIEVDRLAREGRFDQLVIESTGISEPLPVAETFTFEGEDGRSLGEVARLDTMVTVVDAFNFLRDYASRDSLQSRGESMGEEDARTVVDLLIDQIEFCDVIVINKIDLIDANARERLVALLRGLNPRARIEIAEFGKVPLERVLDTGLFDFDEASRAPGWLQEMRGTHTPETDAYGIRSFVYRARRPFHPQRFFDLVEGEWPGVVRSKGFFWLATHPTVAGSWSQNRRGRAARAGRLLVGGHAARALAAGPGSRRADPRALGRARRRCTTGTRADRHGHGRARAARALRRVSADRRRDGHRPRTLDHVGQPVSRLALTRTRFLHRSGWRRRSTGFRA